MKYTGYIVLKHYDKDTKPINTKERLHDTIFLKPEMDIKQKIDNTPEIIPIYTSQEEAEADAEWWPAHTNEDYGVVRKVTITIEEETYNTIKSERKTLNKLIEKYPNDNQARNLKKDKIIQYIDRLRADTRRLTSESISKEVEKLDNVYKNAIDKKQYTAAVNAIRLKSQLLGFLVEKKEVQHSTLDTMNDDELAKYLEQIKSDHNLDN
jgi:hypothetical protein